jgi:hypothetical protein
MGEVSLTPQSGYGPWRVCQMSSSPKLSFTACCSFCLHPRYRKCAAAHLMYLHADMRLKEKALWHTGALGIKPGRYRRPAFGLFGNSLIMPTPDTTRAPPYHLNPVTVGIIGESACRLRHRLDGRLSRKRRVGQAIDRGELQETKHPGRSTHPACRSRYLDEIQATSAFSCRSGCHENA